MKVDLRGGDVLVTQILSDDFERNPFVELPSCTRAPQRGAGRPPGDACPHVDLLDMTLNRPSA